METGFIALNIFVVLALTFTFFPGLLKRLKKDRLSFKDFLLKPKVNYGIYYVFIFSLLSIFYVIFFNSRFKSNPDEELTHLKNEELFDQNYYRYYRKLIANKYDYKSLYLLIDSKEKAGSGVEIDELTTLIYGKIDLTSSEFESLSENAKNIKDKDLGYVGKAIYKLIYYHKPEDAWEELQKINDKNQPFVQTLLGLSADSEHDSETYFENELIINGPIDFTIEKLSRIYFNNDLTKFATLYNNQSYLDFIPNSYKEYYAFKNFYLFDYIKFETERIFKGTTSYILFAVLLIFLIWLFFLLSVDLFEKEKLKYLIFTLLVSFLLMYVCSYIRETLDYYGITDIIIEKTGKLGYYVFVVGLIEETIKIIPFLIILRFTKILNEPIDYILYAALSALMFSVVEDFIYFNNYPISTIYSRAIFTSLGHIGFTAIIAYSFVLTRYFYKKNKIYLNILAFISAITLHGFYDYLITADWALSSVSGTLILCFEIWLISHFISNCLSNSSHFKNHLLLNTKNLGIIISSGLLITIIFTFVHAAKYIDAQYATGKLFMALIWYSYPIYFIKICINRIDIVEGHWNRLSFKTMLNPKFFFAGINHHYWEVLDQELYVQKYGNHTKTISNNLPLKCKVLERVKINDYSGWFYIKLDNPIALSGYFVDHFFIRTKDDFEPISNDERVLCGIYLSKNKENSDIKQLNKKDLIFIDWIFITLLKK